MYYYFERLSDWVTALLLAAFLALAGAAVAGCDEHEIEHDLDQPDDNGRKTIDIEAPGVDIEIEGDRDESDEPDRDVDVDVRPKE